MSNRPISVVPIGGPGGADLLTESDRIHATIESFADGAAIDLGLYAYTPGRGREWRLTASMNAILDTLPTDLVRTITMLVSPTTPVRSTLHRRQRSRF